MRAFPFRKTLLLVLVLALSACAPAVPATALPSTQTPAVLATDLPQPTPTNLPPTPAPTATPSVPPLSFKPATYQDDIAGFQLDYPTGWTLSPKTVIGSRGSQAQIFSPGSSVETLPAGGTRVGITIYQWATSELDFMRSPSCIFCCTLDF